MRYMRNIYYNAMAIRNNIIINCLLIGHIFYPSYFRKKIRYYKKLGEIYYKYLSLLTVNDEIVGKYNIDLLHIGLGLYDKYASMMANRTITNDNDNISELSDLSDLSDLGDMDNLMT